MCLTFIAYLGCTTVGTSGPPVAKSSSNTGKDLVTFELPESVRARAPEMQDHLFKLLPFNSPAYKVKPDWAFIDGETKHISPLNVLVTWLNLFHISYYKDGSLVWSGSVILGEERSTLLNARSGYVWDLTYDKEKGGYRIHFRDEAFEVETHFAADRDHVEELGEDGQLVYFHYYVFPKERMVRKTD
ncbi:hypothetical protein [Sulfidibacter corallicola]|uniref:Uncharacterized protein n=1 Tax=Sulfidibacter corallicola TaxID=2818388 RepID=A0A8A4TWL8_SULCO|nr:hypothetical protein [Sulfidibacter corallicola]QTD53581.1 hypothetical protein J3U87_14090 [Sulfidibacter corallicola]